jgi:acyl dehydratase
MFPGKAFDEVEVGETFSTSLTVTETHLVLAAGLFGDFNPLHVDDSHAAKSRFGGRILHGPFTSALISAPAGMYFHGTAIAYLEHNCRFKAPVRPGDTLRTTWTIAERLEKPTHGGGILVLRARCENQHGDVVAEADGKMLVAARKEARKEMK